MLKRAVSGKTRTASTLSSQRLLPMRFEALLITASNLGEGTLCIEVINVNSRKSRQRCESYRKAQKAKSYSF